MSTTNQSLRARSVVKSAALPAASGEAASSSSSSGAAVDHHADHEEEVEGPVAEQLQRPPSFSQRAVSQTLTGTANLANLLPTGTLLAFQLLTPIFTANGSCDLVTRPLTIILLALLSISCFLASFTDSVIASDGQVSLSLPIDKAKFLFSNNSKETKLCFVLCIHC